MKVLTLWTPALGEPVELPDGAIATVVPAPDGKSFCEREVVWLKTSDRAEPTWEWMKNLRPAGWRRVFRGAVAGQKARD